MHILQADFSLFILVQLFTVFELVSLVWKSKDECVSYVENFSLVRATC